MVVTLANSSCRLAAVARVISTADNIAVGVPPVKGEGRVDREQHVVAKIGPDADRRLATVVGRDAAHDDAGCLLIEQPRV